MDCHTIACCTKNVTWCGLSAFGQTLAATGHLLEKYLHLLGNKQTRRSLQRGDKRFLILLE
jgi:hypothetical protein